MKQFYLYHLFRHSKTGFIFVILFIICYALFFSKKMDATLFPYNSMFAIDFTKNNMATGYVVKINNEPVRISQNLYWKKDFLEESLINYAKYKKNGDAQFMDQYLEQKITDSTTRSYLLNKLTPGKISYEQYMKWYIQFAGYNIPKGATIELFQYEISFDDSHAMLKDSAIMYKSIFN